MPITKKIPATERLIPNILMTGTGEYTTGWIGGKGSASDKKMGVVALVLFDQRRLGNVGNLSMVGTNGTKFPDIRNHLQSQIGDVYRDMDTSFNSFPEDDVSSDPKAYLRAMDAMQPGDGVIVFTPDDIHYEIGKAAIERGLHLMLTKPPVKTLEHHLALCDAAVKEGVLVDIEVHKRFDPIYADAREVLRGLGDFSYFSSYMTQPKFQIKTFPWAGKSSDISYYLNSHHIDFHVWAMEGIAKPIRVTASAATGIAQSMGIDTEDQITLLVDWLNIGSGNMGTAVYTAGWVEPPSDGHTQQRFECMMHQGKVQADQTRRGYTITEEGKSLRSGNPLYMKYTPDELGHFNGQSGYGYVSIAKFVEAIGAIINGESDVVDFERTLPTIGRTVQLTAILEAGRISLDNDGIPINIYYGSKDSTIPISLSK